MKKLQTRRAVETILVQVPYFHSMLRVVGQRSPGTGRHGQRFREDEHVCAQSGLFDAEWYLQRNPDVAAAGIDPLAHYLRKGAAEGRDPNPLFDSDWYLGRNPDVAAAGMNPLRHYIGWGAAEGRDPNPHFDSNWYLERNPDVAGAGMNPLLHYIRCGSAEGRDPNPLFDSKWYLERNPDLARSGANPLAHYIHFGAAKAQCDHAPASLRAGSPTVSAIVPCYNGARWLAEALESIKAQSLPVQEIIVVDDASTDDSAAIGREHGASVIRNATNRGEGYSRNAGLRRASGDLIAWLDADDVWLPQHVKTLSDLLQKYPRATAAFGAVQRFGLRNELIRGYVPPGQPSNVFWLAFRDWLHTTIGSMTRKTALSEIGGFNEQERYSVDFDLWLRLSRHHLFTCTHEVTSRWRWHDAQQSQQLERQLAAVYRFRRSYWEQERTAGLPAVAAEMERRMADIWNEDMNAACEKRDVSHLRFLCELTELVPGIPRRCREGWTHRVEERQVRSEVVRFDDERICRESGLFDAEWYRQRYPDVADAMDDPLRHYVRLGWLEARDPHPLFDTDWYIAQNPDLCASGENPLAHYVRVGAAQGRDPNPLFDTDWYLERNPDVLAAGTNPLSHYVRWGAAKGLDPSEGFQTVWYLARHPDVAEAGMNPLAHYIHWGSVELREPISPIPFIFKKLAIKPPSCSRELERLLSIYSSPPDVAPPRARRDNNSQAGVSWAEQSLFDCGRRFACGDLEGALRFAKHAVQILPHEDDPITLFAELFRKWNSAALENFTQRFAGADCLVVHISHKGGVHRAQQSCHSFDDDSGKIANIIVVADETAPEHCYSFDDARSILYVPANDRYEGLPGKVAKAFVFLGFCSLNLPILKVDDDSICMDLSRLKTFVNEVMSRHMHGGRINTRLYPFGSSYWHFGKCGDQTVNTRPDGLLCTAAYVGGEGYWLNAAAVNAMAKIAVIHERYFETEYFEDRAVGSVLYHYGVEAHSFDLFAAGILHDLGLPAGSRENPPVQLRGSRATSLR